MRLPGLVLACLVSFGSLVVWTAGSSAQQIFRWTDENGNLHFGNQPPPNAKDLEAEDRPKSQTETECAGEVRNQCLKLDKMYGAWARSDAYRDCIDRGMETCLQFKPRSKPTEASQRVLSTSTLHFDPADGDSLRCEMRCRSACRGTVEIRTDRVLKKGENYGTQRYTVEVEPRQAGSAFCSVTTTSKDALLVLGVVRGGIVTASTEAQ